MLTRAVEVHVKALGPGHPDVAIPTGTLAEVESDRGRHEEAVRLARRALEIREERLAPAHRLRGVALSLLGRVLTAAGRGTEGRPYLERAVAAISPMTHNQEALAARSRLRSRCSAAQARRAPRRSRCGARTGGSSPASGARLREDPVLDARACYFASWK